MALIYLNVDGNKKMCLNVLGYDSRFCSCRGGVCPIFKTTLKLNRAFKFYRCDFCLYSEVSGEEDLD